MAAADAADAEPPPLPDEATESDMDTIVTSADSPDDKLEDGGKNKSSNSSVGKYASLSRALQLPRRRATASLKAVNMKSKRPKDKSGAPNDGGGLNASSSPSATSASSAAPPTATLRALLHKFFAQLQGHGHLPNGGSRKHSQPPPPSEERIQEWKRRMEEGKVPGVVGIKNHGNTCFINAILQCLSYTDILAEYFVLDQYKSDLRRKRRISSLAALRKRAATAANGASSTDRGEVTEQLAVLLKSMWSLQYDPEISIRFKSLVEKHASQYKGSSQHDAQEFLLWLLDQVHEDLNVASRRKYKPPPPPPPPPAPQQANGVCKSGHAGGGLHGGPHPHHNQQCNDEVMAAEALAAYMRCNNSFVMDVFQAQFRSSLQCPTCERVSNTFDPFLCVSLPIPHRVLLPVFVTVLYIDQCPRQVRLGLTVDADETVGGLRSVLAKDTGIALERLLLCEIDDVCFRRTFRDRDSVQLLKGAKTPLYCIETPDYKEPSDDSGAFAVLTWINVFKPVLQAGGKRVEKRFGSPYTIQVSRETLYTDLQKLLMKEMAPILHDDILISNQKVPLFRMRVLDCLEGRDSAPPSSSEKAKSDTGSDPSSDKDKDKEAVYVDPVVDLPLYTEMVEQSINLGNLERESSGVPTHVKLVLEWDMPAKTQVINDDGDSIEEHASVKEVEAAMRAEEESASVSLQECFSLYTSAEKLGIGDAWLCPSCNRKQEVVKRMGLWSVPDVLVIHLKRFRQTSGSSTNKITTLVDFPLENFDMTPNMAKQQNKEMAAKQHHSPPATVPTADVDCSNAATSNAASMSSNGLNGMWSALSPWKNPKKFVAAELQHKFQRSASDDSVYELYAVCNHHGSDLQGGHYTAFCKNPTDGQWYNFDDIRTKSIAEQDVVTNDAYILFYQRQSSLFNSSQSSSSDSSNAEHWVFRMPDFTYKRKTPGAATSPATAPSTSPKETEKSSEVPKSPQTATATTPTSNFVRNGGKYATMVPVSKRAGGGEGEPECEGDAERRHSDVDLVADAEEESDERKEEGSSPDSKVAPDSKSQGGERTSKSDGCGGGGSGSDDDGICRPVDKNDVD